MGCGAGCGRQSLEVAVDVAAIAVVERAAAMSRAKAQVEQPETDDPRADLEMFLRKMTNNIFGPKSCFVIGFMTALRNDPELGRVFRESLLTEMRDQLRRPIARVVGDDDPDLDLRVDLAPAFLIFRTLIDDQPTDPDDLARRLCALVLGSVSLPLIQSGDRLRCSSWLPPAAFREGDDGDELGVGQGDDREAVALGEQSAMGELGDRAQLVE